jgi:hypothetical protein
MAEAKGINIDITTEVTTPEIVTEEIVATTEEIVAEVKEEAIEAPSRLREKFRRWEVLWDRTAVQFYKAPKL